MDNTGGQIIDGESIILVSMVTQESLKIDKCMRDKNHLTEGDKDTFARLAHLERRS